MQIIGHYMFITIFIIYLIKEKNRIVLTLQFAYQHQVLLEHFKVLSNSFNEAIITKSEEGHLDYCNMNGIKLLLSIFKKRGSQETPKILKYFEKLKQSFYQFYNIKDNAQKHFMTLLHEKLFVLYQSNEMKNIT